MKPLSSDQIEALSDTLCKAFWNKRPFSDFLRRSGVSPTDLGQLYVHPTKREFLRWLFGRYEQSASGQQLMRDIAVSLTAKSFFPDLEPEQIRVAKIAIEALKGLFPAASLRSQQPPTPPEAAAPRQPARIDVEPLRTRFDEIYLQLGTAPGGRAFETWFVEFANAFGLSARGRYNTSEREFDGSLSLDGSTYLLELKFTGDKTDASDVSNFRDKVSGHASGTLGLAVSVTGYTSNAIATAARAGSPLVLMDGAHLYRVLQGGQRLDDLIRLLRRHAIETGQTYNPVATI